MNGLEQAITDYWNVSLAYHQGVGLTITTSEAISLTGERAADLGPHRRVKHKLLWLQDRIIVGRHKRKKDPPPQNVLPFKVISQ